MKRILILHSLIPTWSQARLSPVSLMPGRMATLNSPITCSLLRVACARDLQRRNGLNVAMNGSTRLIQSDSNQTSCMNTKHRNLVSGCPIRLAGGAQPLTKWLRSAGRLNLTLFPRITNFPHYLSYLRQLLFMQRQDVTGSGQVTRLSRKKVDGAFKT